MFFKFIRILTTLNLMLSYLPCSYSQKKDAVEKTFCIPFMQLMKVRGRPCPSLEQIMSIESNVFQNWQVEELRDRMGIYHSFWVGDDGLKYLSRLSETICESTMYLTYLQYWAHFRSKKRLSLKDVSTLFEPGLPSNPALKKLWYSLKINSCGSDCCSDCLLDYPRAYTSILF